MENGVNSLCDDVAIKRGISMRRQKVRINADFQWKTKHESSTTVETPS